MNIKFFLVSICLIMSAISTEDSLKFLESKNFNMQTVHPTPSNRNPGQECIQSNGTVISSVTIFDTSMGYVEGLESEFCFVENEEGNSCMIDLQTLTSEKPSLAATYFLKGVDLENLPSPFSIQAVCQLMKGTSIGYYTNGGYLNKYGVDEVCVFADSSKVSTWALLYVSEDPNYMNLRSRIKSQPIPLNLPFIGDGTAKRSDNIDKEKLMYQNLFKPLKK